MWLLLPSGWPAVHLPARILSEIAAYYNRLGHLGLGTMNVVVIPPVMGGNECSADAFFSPSFACFVCVDSNLHGDINVTVMFYPRALKRNC